jgi:arylsulfatase A-like enzyme
MPFPRCKSNNYDSGARVPLAIRWPERIEAGTVVNDFVSLIDLAPTYFEAAGVAIPNEVSGRSLLALLGGEEHGDRGFVLHGKERHVPGQEAPDLGGYPTRALRTHRYLYLHNFLPDRWPAGTPRHQKSSIPGAWLADCDNGPTKSYIVEHQDRDEELVNVAADPEYSDPLRRLKEKLFAELKRTADPRVTGTGPDFDRFPYLGGAPRYPKKAE